MPTAIEEVEKVQEAAITFSVSPEGNLVVELSGFVPEARGPIRDFLVQIFLAALKDLGKTLEDVGHIGIPMAGAKVD